MKFNKRYTLFGILVVVLVGGYLVFRNNTQKTNTSTPDTQQVTRGTIVTSVSGSGSLVPQSQSDIFPPSYGIIDKVFAKDGQDVKAGDALFHFKSLASASDVAKAKASLLSSLESLNKARASASTLQASFLSSQQQLQDAERNVYIAQNSANSSKLALDKSRIEAQKSLTDARKGVIDSANTQAKASTDLDISSSQVGEESAALALDSAKISSKQSVVNAQVAYDQATRDADAAILKRDSAKYSLEAARQNLNNQNTTIAAAEASYASSKLSYQDLTDQTITAPVSGKLANFSLQAGTVVGKSNDASTSNSTTSDSTSNTSLFSIISAGNFVTSISINEVDIPKIKAGQSATLSFTAIPNKTFIGHVLSADTIGTTSQGVTTYNVIIALDDTNDEIRPGMSVSASIITDRKDNVLTVPNSAIRTSAGQSTVSVLRNGLPTTTNVTIGMSNDVETEIISGVNEGEEVVVQNASSTISGGRSGNLFGGRGFSIMGAPRQ